MYAGLRLPFPNIILLTLEQVHWEMALVRWKVVVWEQVRWATGVFVMGRHGGAWCIALEMDGGVTLGGASRITIGASGEAGFGHDFGVALAGC